MLEYPRIISNGTLRIEDLLTCFISEVDSILEDRIGEKGMDAADKVAQAARANDILGDIERRMESEGYYESDDAMWDMERVTDLLSELAPDGFWFGANEGDGACFGFWATEPDAESLAEEVERIYEAWSADTLNLAILREYAEAIANLRKLAE